MSKEETQGTNYENIPYMYFHDLENITDNEKILIQRINLIIYELRKVIDYIKEKGDSNEK